MSFERILRQKARELPDYPVPPAIRPRLLDELRIETTESRLPVSLVFRVAIGFALLGMAGSVMVANRHPHLAPTNTVSYTTAADPSANVDTAVRQSNTWHFSGWKLQNGKRVHWEIWGRRSPFAYRETLGDQQRQILGEKDLWSLPASYRNEVGGRIYIKTPLGANSSFFSEDTHLAFLTGISAANFHDTGEKFAEWAHVVQAHSSSAVTLRFNATVFKPFEVMVNTEEKLPESVTIFDKSPSNGVSPKVVAELKTEYGTPIPDEFGTFTTPKASSVLPLRLVQPELLTRFGNGIWVGASPAKEEAAWTAETAKASAASFAVHPDGNVLMRVQAIEDEVPLDAAKQHLHLRAVCQNAMLIGQDDNQVYPVVYLLDLHQNQADPSWIEVQTGEPISWYGKSPLKLSVTASLQLGSELPAKTLSGFEFVPIVNLGTVTLQKDLSSGLHPLANSFGHSLLEGRFTPDSLCRMRASAYQIGTTAYYTKTSKSGMPKGELQRRRREPIFVRREAYWYQRAAEEDEKIASKKRSNADPASASDFAERAISDRKRAAEALNQAADLDKANQKQGI